MCIAYKRHAISYRWLHHQCTYNTESARRRHETRLESSDMGASILSISPISVEDQHLTTLGNFSVIGRRRVVSDPSDVTVATDVIVALFADSTGGR